MSDGHATTSRFSTAELVARLVGPMERVLRVACADLGVVVVETIASATHEAERDGITPRPALAAAPFGHRRGDGALVEPEQASAKPRGPSLPEAAARAAADEPPVQVEHGSLAPIEQKRAHGRIRIRSRATGPRPEGSRERVGQAVSPAPSRTLVREGSRSSTTARAVDGADAPSVPVSVPATPPARSTMAVHRPIHDRAPSATSAPTAVPASGRLPGSASVDRMQQPPHDRGTTSFPSLPDMQQPPHDRGITASPTPPGPPPPVHPSPGVDGQAASPSVARPVGRSTSIDSTIPRSLVRVTSAASITPSNSAPSERASSAPVEPAVPGATTASILASSAPLTPIHTDSLVAPTRLPARDPLVASLARFDALQAPTGAPATASISEHTLASIIAAAARRHGIDT